MSTNMLRNLLRRDKDKEKEKDRDKDRFPSRPSTWIRRSSAEGTDKSVSSTHSIPIDEVPPPPDDGNTVAASSVTALRRDGKAFFTSASVESSLRHVNSFPTASALVQQSFPPPSPQLLPQQIMSSSSGKTSSFPPPPAPPPPPPPSSSGLTFSTPNQILATKTPPPPPISRSVSDTTSLAQRQISVVTQDTSTSPSVSTSTAPSSPVKAIPTNGMSSKEVYKGTSVTTDVSNTFKVGFQQMATKCATMQEELNELRAATKAQESIRASHEALVEELDDARAGIEKERQRADGSTNEIRKTQNELRDIKAALAARTREVGSLKKELEKGDQNSVRELMQREKAAESAMLRKAREIADLTKKLTKSEASLKESRNDAVGLQKSIDVSARQVQTLQESLRAEKQRGLEKVEALERTKTASSERQSDLNAAKLRMDSLDTEKSKLESEVRALQKGLDSAKGEGSDAAARVSEKERLLSLRSDEVRLAGKIQEKTQTKLEDARAELKVAQRDLASAGVALSELEKNMKDQLEKATKGSLEAFDDAKRTISRLEKDAEFDKKSFERELADLGQSKSKEVTDNERKMETLREHLANESLSWTTQKREMRMQIEESTESLAAKEHEVRTLTGKLQAAESEYEDANWRLERANTKVADVRAAAKLTEKELMKEVHDFRGQVSALTGSSREAEKKARSAEAAVEDAKSELIRVQKKLNLTSEEVTSTKKSLQTNEINFAVIQHERDEAVAEQKRIEEQLSVVRVDSERLAKEANEHSQKVNDLTDELQEVKSHAKETNEGLEVSKRGMGSLEEELNKKKDELNQVKVNLDREAKLRQELETEVQEVSRLQELVSEHEGAISQLESKLSETNEETMKVQSRSFESAKRVEEVNSDLQRVIGERDAGLQKVEEMKKEVEQEQEAAKALERASRDIVDQLMNMKNEVEVVNRREEEALGKIQQTEMERKEQETRVEELVKSLKSSEEKSAELKEKVGDLDNRIVEVTTEKEQVIKKLSDKEQRFVHIQALGFRTNEKLEKVTSERDELKIQLKDSDDARAKLDTEVDEKLKILDDFQAEVAQQATLITERESQLQSATRDVEEARESAARLREQMEAVSQERDVYSRDGESALGALTEAEKALEAEREHRTEAERAKEEVREKVVDLEERLRQTVAERETSIKDANAKQIEIARLLQVEIDIKTDLEKSEFQYSISTEKLNELTVAVQGMEALLADRQRAYDDLVTERDEVRRRADELGREVADRERKEIQMEKDLQDAIRAQADLTRGQVQLQEELATTANALADLKLKSEQDEKAYAATAASLEKELLAKDEEFKQSIAQIELMEQDVNAGEEEVDKLRKSEEELNNRLEAVMAEHTESYERALQDRDEIAREHSSVAETNSDLLKKLDEADEAGQSLARDLEETRQRTQEYETRVGELEEELNKVGNDVTNLEWSLNEQTLRADQADNEVVGLRDQGRNIYAQIEEFGEEAEARVLEAENELQAKLEDISVLESRVAELTNENAEANENGSSLKTRLNEARSEQSRLIVEKESAERRLELARNEGTFQTERISTLEGVNRELSTAVESAKMSSRDAEDRAIREERRASEDKQRVLELQSIVDRLRGVETRSEAAEAEVSRLKQKMEEAQTIRARIEIERDTMGEKFRLAEERFHTEKRSIIMEHRLELDDVRRGSDINSQDRSIVPPMRMSETGSQSSRRTGRILGRGDDDNESTAGATDASSASNRGGNILIGATAAVGTMGLVALRILTNAAAGGRSSDQSVEGGSFGRRRR